MVQVYEKSHLKPRMHSNTGQLKCFMIIFSVLIVFDLVDSCYLKNCPLGKREGKRNGEESGIRKMCPRCGPDGQGRCAGPYTCCMENGGCMIGINSLDTAPCVREQKSPIPCIFDNEPVRCGKNNEGVCASNAVCCTEDACVVSSECEYPAPTEILQGY